VRRADTEVAMMNPRIGTRKKVQLLVLLTLLAWATQTLFHQWGYGALIMPQTGSASALATGGSAAGTILEIRPQIQTPGATIMLRDVCRWSEKDQAVLEPVADLVVSRLSDAPGVRTVSVEQIKSALHDAGVNVSDVQFSGAALCAVTVGKVDAIDIERAVMRQDVDATTQPAAQPTADPKAADSKTADSKTGVAPAPVVADAQQTPLKDLLLAQLHEELKLSPEQMQVDFDTKNQAVLAMTSPRCKFDITPQGTTTLGPVAWEIVVKSDKGERRETVTATARAWENQLVLARQLSQGQTFIKSDVVEKCVLVDQLADNALTKSDDVLGEVAARDLKSGAVLTVNDATGARAVQAGESITVAMKLGKNRVETVAKALDDGARGNTVRAKNEANGDVYQVRITGPNSGDVTAITASGIASTDSN
jgi:flagella basal body P-ring formation protein FlgA